MKIFLISCIWPFKELKGTCDTEIWIKWASSVLVARAKAIIATSGLSNPSSDGTRLQPRASAAATDSH